MIKNKEVIKNAFYNVIKTLCGVLFPLITFPYATRILGAVNFGKYSFSSSIISYVTLLAAFGISNYVIREGARIRNDNASLQALVNSIFTLNCFTTTAAYIVLCILLVCWNKLYSYSYLILILSISIFFTTVGTDWINVIFEDYRYIAKRYIFCSLIQMLLLFIVVRKENDIYNYAVVSILPNVLANILNIFYIRKKYLAKIKIVFNKELLIHLKATSVFFVNSIVTIIYINSDITILGIIKDDLTVGVYSIASKMYVLVKHVIGAIVAVIIPKVSLMINEKKIDKINEILSETIKTVIYISIPCSVGLALFSSNIIMLLFGTKYHEAYYSLTILAVALPFAALANIFVNCIMIPYKKEKTTLIITMISAVINIVLNIFLIPIFSHKAAALTTLIAELFVFAISFLNSKKVLLIYIGKYMKIPCCEALIILLCYYFFKLINANVIVSLIGTIIISVLIYILMLCKEKDNLLYDIIYKILHNKRYN